MLGGLPPIDFIITFGIVIFTAIGLHEYAHCKVADMAGDPTPRSYGRVTLNLTKHFEPTGTMMIIFTMMSGFGIGWGRPAPFNPTLMRNPRWDLLASVVAGPASNILQAAVWAIMLRIAMITSPGAVFTADGATFLGMLFQYGVFVNLLLAVFNLIPLGPLDGHWIIGQFLPEKPRLYWYRFHRKVGMYGLIAVIIGSQLVRYQTRGEIDPFWDLIGPPVYFMYSFFTGLPGIML